MRVLIVDPDSQSRDSLRRAFGESGEQTRSVENLPEARRHLVEFRPDAIIVALDFPARGGESLLEEVLRQDPCRAVYALVDRERLEDGVAAMARGARDFLWRPVTETRISLLRARLTERLGQEARAEELRLRFARAEVSACLLGRSAPFQAVMASIERAASAGHDILLTGETGTEQEETARALHGLSSRGAESFLIAPEGKGYEASRSQRGTLFVPGLESTLSALQQEVVRDLETPRSFRMILATNREPGEAVAAGKILPELFEILRDQVVHLPPLRERGEDISLLARRFLAEIDGSLYFDAQAMDVLSAHDWPGNVRELREAVERATRLADRTPIGSTVVLSVLGGARATRRPRRKKPPVVRVAVGASLADVERRLIQKTLEFARGSKPRTAQLLKLSLKTIYNKIKEYGLEH
ncbi:MAG: sigma-54-dependent transcriptional regulator [Thermoanaerobaculia bacterium]